MKNKDSDGSSDHEWEEAGDLVWREIDWEQYLREQDAAIGEYLDHYDALAGHTERLDEVARRMGWAQSGEEAEIDNPVESDQTSEPSTDDDWEPCTLPTNPVYIATKALHLSLTKTWERLAADPVRVPPPLGIAMLATLNRAHEQAGLASQALDLGDYGLATCLFKRALRELNTALAHFDAGADGGPAGLVAYREYALPRLFDLREIWLRVMHECRNELGPETDVGG
jgi:hypothetical protein